MRAGNLLRPHPSLREIRDRCAAEIAALPEPLKQLRGAGEYRVQISEALRTRQEKARNAVSSEQ
jgi:hypothetical protein